MTSLSLSAASMPLHQVGERHDVGDDLVGVEPAGADELDGVGPGGVGSGVGSDDRQLFAVDVKRPQRELLVAGGGAVGDDGPAARTMSNASR